MTAVEFLIVSCALASLPVSAWSIWTSRKTLAKSREEYWRKHRQLWEEHTHGYQSWESYAASLPVYKYDRRWLRKSGHQVATRDRGEVGGVAADQERGARPDGQEDRLASELVDESADLDSIFLYRRPHALEQLRRLARGDRELGASGVDGRKTHENSSADSAPGAATPGRSDRTTEDTGGGAGPAEGPTTSSPYDL